MLKPTDQRKINNLFYHCIILIYELIIPGKNIQTDANGLKTLINYLFFTNLPITFTI